MWPTSEAQKPLGERSKVSLKANHTPYFRCESRSHSSVTCPCTENARGVLIPGVSPLSALPPKPTLNPSLLTTQGSLLTHAARSLAGGLWWPFSGLSAAVLPSPAHLSQPPWGQDVGACHFSILDHQLSHSGKADTSTCLRATNAGLSPPSPTCTLLSGPRPRLRPAWAFCTTAPDRQLSQTPPGVVVASPFVAPPCLRGSHPPLRPSPLSSLCRAGWAFSCRCSLFVICLPMRISAPEGRGSLFTQHPGT